MATAVPALGDMSSRLSVDRRDQGRAHDAFERTAHVATLQEVARARDCGCVTRKPYEGHQAEYRAKQHEVRKGAVG